MMTAGHPLWPLYCWLRPRKVAYEKFKNSDEGKVILRDLAKLCLATAPTKTERDLGKRDVWLHIQRFMQLNDEELTVLFQPLTPEQRHQIWKPGTTYFADE